MNVYLLILTNFCLFLQSRFFKSELIESLNFRISRFFLLNVKLHLHYIWWRKYFWWSHHFCDVILKAIEIKNDLINISFTTRERKPCSENFQVFSPTKTEKLHFKWKFKPNLAATRAVFPTKQGKFYSFQSINSFIHLVPCLYASIK